MVGDWYNPVNINVQNRMTGQLEQEKMQVYQKCTSGSDLGYAR